MSNEYDITVRLTIITDSSRDQIRDQAWLYATSASSYLPQPIIEDVKVSKSTWMAEQKKSRFLWEGKTAGPDS